MDASETAEAALEYALIVHDDAHIAVLHVVGEPSPMLAVASSLALEDDFEAAARAHAEEIFASAEAIAREHGAAIDTITEIGHPARVIIEVAEEFDAIVMGTHGGSLLDRLIVGDVAKTVFRRSTVPVTTVR